jgi:hypothetical protein
MNIILTMIAVLTFGCVTQSAFAQAALNGETATANLKTRTFPATHLGTYIY